jgi:hypothetical protein
MQELGFESFLNYSDALPKVKRKIEKLEGMILFIIKKHIRQDKY